MAQVTPAIKDVQLATGVNNVKKWNVRAESEQKQYEKEIKMKALLHSANAMNKDSDNEILSGSDQEVYEAKGTKNKNLSTPKNLEGFDLKKK